MSAPSDTTPREEPGRLSQASASFISGCRRWGARAWPWMKAARSASLRREAGLWAGRLAEEKDELLSLVGGMENEFLRTGEELVRLSQQLSEMQAACRTLSDLTMGQAEDAAVQFAFQLLKKAEDLVLASYDQYDHVSIASTELRERLAELSRQHQDLIRILQPLHFITMAMRIEASRQPAGTQEVFVTLATDLNQTVDEVRATLEGQFAGLAAGERIVQTLMTEVTASIGRHRRDVASTLATCRGNLRALSGALASSGAGAADLSQRNQAATAHLGGIIMAQQCQDITRQKIEHIGEAIDEMRDHLDAARTTVFAVDTETRPFVFHAAQIQLQQVRGVFDGLDRAADGLRSGMEGLRAAAVAAASVAVKVGSTTLDAKVASPCQAGIAGILQIIEQAVRRIAEILVAFAPLQASFVNCTTKAIELAGDVRYAALNAQVFAIQAPQGATLEVLAGRVGAVSDEAIVHVEQMCATLVRTGELVNNLRQRLTDFQQLGQVEQEILSGESVRSRKKLLDLERAIPALVRRITTQQAAFAKSVDAVLANVRFPVAVARSSARSIGFFQELVDWGNDGGAVVASGPSRKIDRLRANYTMATERHIHAAALSPSASGAGGAAAPEAVELFDEADAPPPATVTSLGTILSAEERPDELPRPADFSAVDSTRRPAAAVPTMENAPDGAGMGDNVELF